MVATCQSLEIPPKLVLLDVIMHLFGSTPQIHLFFGQSSNPFVPTPMYNKDSESVELLSDPNRRPKHRIQGPKQTQDWAMKGRMDLSDSW